MLREDFPHNLEVRLDGAVRLRACWLHTTMAGSPLAVLNPEDN